MSMHDLPVGRRRDDFPAQPTDVTQAPAWDIILDRLARLERSHADLARYVESIHEALPPEIAARTGRPLALGSPIDALPSPIVPPPPPPIFGTPATPFRVEAPTPAIDPFSQRFEAPDPWATPEPQSGDAFFRPLDAGTAMAALERPKRRRHGSLLSSRRLGCPRPRQAFSAPGSPIRRRCRRRPRPRQALCRVNATSRRFRSP
jgi:hypothetical protein